jgi:hypothetical protein
VSQVIEFLERLGQDARLRHASIDEVSQALAQAGIEGPARALILSGDRPALESLLDAKPNVFCGVLVPEEVEEEKEDEKEDDEHEDGDEDEEEKE